MPRGVVPVALLGTLCIVAAGAAPGPTASCWPGAPGTDPMLCPPDDPDYQRRWEYTSTIPPAVDRSRMHPAEAALGSIGMSIDAAWQLSIGREDVIIAVLDSGIRWGEPDLQDRLYLNPGELPPPAGFADHDADGDGVLRAGDYAGDERVGDRNGNGRLDAQDLIRAFSDCVDDDGNGYADDIAGYDFFGGGHCGRTAGDNDPLDDTDFGHGTGIAEVAAGTAGNGIGGAGVCPRCRVLPVRVGDSFVVDANRFARGLEFAVHAGASVVAAALGSYNDTPAARRALDLAYAHGVAVIASAADEYSYHHNFPSVHNHALYVNAIRFNHVDDWRKASTFWGVNPCTNFGARVWVTVPAVSCSSGATARLAGVAGLVVAASRDAGHGDLAAEEVYQIVRDTADDLDTTGPGGRGLRWIARPGFDQYYGYGRVNALRAVRAAREGRIPPIVDLLDPDWFALLAPAREPRVPVRGVVRAPRATAASFRLEYALGVEPAESDYVVVASGESRGESAGVLGVLDLGRLPRPSGPAPRDRGERDRYSATLRLRAVDDRGLVAEARRSFFVIDDPTWVAGFPLRLGASGEAGPVLVDLDGDGRDEIVLPTADGVVRILRAGPEGVAAVEATLDEATPARPGGIPSRETVVRAAAVGDLDGDGRSEIVVTSREGKVYAFERDGRRVAGFPASIDAARAATAGLPLEAGLLSRPTLADLDRRPGLEIVAGALDGKLYAWRAGGRRLAGFPVALGGTQDGSARDKVVSSAAVGDLDGDGSPDIVVGSNGTRRGAALAYAVRAAGLLHPNGPLLPGWPIELPAVRPDLLPTVATGVQMDPVLADVDGDGDEEAVLYAVTGSAVVLVDQHEGAPAIVSRFSLEPAAGSEFRDTYFLGGTGSPLLADTDRDGALELYAPLLPFRMLTLRAKPGVPLDAAPALGGWPLGRSTAARRGVSMLAGWPRRMEDLMIFARPLAVDVDGDGIDEVLMGSGGYLLHAFRRDGGEAAGFPKFTGGWIFSAPAAGDLDGDGTTEIVSVTREGYLFAWRSGAPRDPRNLAADRPRD